MLPSSGYFQSVICPFFNSGLCERPHCHFRHVKKETFGKSTFNTLIDESLIRNAREDGREPDILEMVDNAIKQAERDVERNKAVLEATSALSSKQYESVAPVIYIPTPKSSVPTSRSVSHVEPKISKSSSIPQYHPTPISKLKKLQKQYDPVNNFSTPVQPVKRKKHSEYKISEAKYIISGKESSEEDDGYIPKKVNLSENKEVDIQKEICKFSESDDDQDITAEFSANDSDGEKDDIPNISESNKSVDIQNKLLVSDIQTNNTLNSQTEEKSPVNKAINEFSLVDKILLESKKCEEIINNSKNKTDIILSNKLSIDKSDKIINNSKIHNEKSHNLNKVKHKTERHDETDIKSKTLIKKKSETDESLQKKNHSDSKLNKEKKSDKHVEKTVKLKTDKAQKLPVTEAKHKEKTKSHSFLKDTEVNSVAKSSNKKHAEDSKTRKDVSNHKSPRRDRSVSISSNDVSDDTKIKEIKTEKNSKKITEGNTKISKSEAESKGKEAKENSKASKSENKGKEIKGEKNSKKKLEESKSSKHAGKSKSSEKIESSHKKSKSKDTSKTDKKENENEVDSCNFSNTNFDISDVAIDLDSDLDEHDTYEECWKIFNEENEKKDPLSEEANLNKIRQIEESKVKDEEIVILGKKRVAHQPSLSRTVSNVTTTRLSPGQVLHNRYSKLQEMYRNADKTEEKKANSAFLSRLTQFEVGKKRIAHVPNASLLVAAAERQKLLNKTLTVTASTSATTATTVAKGERRIAHVPIMLKSKRPVIPAEYGSKVPCNIRQRYLENFIDECLKFCENEEQAFQVALEEEKNAYNRSSNKTVYLNVAVNTLKRLRNKRPIIDINSEDNLESKRSKLVDSNLNKTISHEYVLGGPKAAKTSFSIERRKVVKIDDDIKGKKLYNLLKPYIMTEKQLEENGFPRLDPANPGKAIITNSYQKKPVCNNPLERTCCRCQTKYRVTVKGKYVKEEECIYHWGRLWKRRIAGAIESRYSCCQGDSLSDGCCVAKGHVFENNETENLSGYVKTLIKSPPPDDNYGTYALDCEMCYSTAGVELARITVIGPDLKPVYETLVKPEHEILDLNTRFSGINEGDLDKVSTTIEDVQAVLLSLFNSNTILIGHSLESDFKALKLIHSTVVDTSVVFPHKMGPPYKRALRTLMAEYLNKIIQNSVDGHDSQEDALACMELMLWKIKEDVKKSLR
ncbi:RNA exonuclease 1 homolog isoform X1 [Centruroides sculpturatus]|uniref:RNA exonuclease 1 homolog isoform X1 n=1 Tax=Centruroides sculpturatus TaxID=218467 RepID=UPI000C6D4280|nr:RNA exonuclease 1 homolog isoform X1 [Centruroides sculpturatus]